MLTGALGRLMAVAEAYPDLKANQNFLQLQGELADIENKIAAARRFFNNAVGEYNASIQRFPAVLIAGAAGFTPRDFFDVGRRPRGDADRPAGEVQLAGRKLTCRRVGLQTYIWNNNIRSALLLIGFPVLLLGMVFFLTLGMIWARHAAARRRIRRRRRRAPSQLMVERRAAGDRRGGGLVRDRLFLQPGDHRLRHRLAAA